MPQQFNNCRLRRALQASRATQKVCRGPQEITQAVEDARAALRLDADQAGTATRLAEVNPAYELLDPSLRVSKPVKSEKTRQVVVPVYLTLMIKKFMASRSEADEDGISLVGHSHTTAAALRPCKLPRCSRGDGDALLCDASERGRDVRRRVF